MNPDGVDDCHFQWTPNGPGLTYGYISRLDVDRLSEFLKATGWKCIYTLQLVTGSPEEKADEANYVNQKLGDSLYSFAIGNEPQFFTKDPHTGGEYKWIDHWGWNYYKLKSLVSPFPYFYV